MNKLFEEWKKKNLLKGVSVIFLILSFLMFFYVFYRSQIIHSGTQLEYYFLYYSISLIFIIFSLFSFFIKNELKINLLIVLISTLVGLYIIELLLFENYKRDKLKNTKADRFYYYQELKEQDPEVVISLMPRYLRDKNNLEYYSLSGISNSKTINCNENGYYSIYQSDRYGFNNPDTEWEKQEIEFFLIGDSFVHGDCVNEPYTISGNLRRLVDNKKKGVLNLGQSGNGPLTEYATLKEYFPKNKVNRILWFYFENNDLYELNSELNNKILNSYFKDKSFTQNLILNRKQVKKLLLNELKKEIDLAKKNSPSEREIKKNSYSIFDLFKLYHFRKFFRNYNYKNYYQKNLNNFKKIIAEASEFSKQNNSKFYFIYIHDIKTDMKDNIDRYNEYEKIIKFTESLKFPVIEINKELFEMHSDFSILFPPDSKYHFSNEGYRYITEKIFDRIKEIEK